MLSSFVPRACCAGRVAAPLRRPLRAWSGSARMRRGGMPVRRAAGPLRGLSASRAAWGAAHRRNDGDIRPCGRKRRGWCVQVRGTWQGGAAHLRCQPAAVAAETRGKGPPVRQAPNASRRYMAGSSRNATQFCGETARPGRGLGHRSGIATGVTQTSFRPRRAAFSRASRRQDQRRRPRRPINVA